MPRTAKLEGRDHYVIPMTMLTVGVHRGSSGPVLYLPDDLRKSVPGWNGRPVVVMHPAIGSAGHPEVLNQQRIGWVFNTRFDDPRLLAEAWIDKERVAQVDDRVLQTIIHDRPMEISTGLFFGFDESQGTWNGQSFVAIARNHVPDHLAILPDAMGACSIRDGCGLLVNEYVMEMT